MSEELKPWEYWKEPDFPECKHDWGGVNSDPDHCIDCCDRTEKYLLSKIPTRPSPSEEAEAKSVVERILNVVEFGPSYLAVGENLISLIHRYRALDASGKEAA